MASTVEEFKSKYPARRIEPVVADFSKLSDASNIPDLIKAKNLRVTLLINNVGATDGEICPFEDTKVSILEDALTTSVVFFTKLCYRMVPILKEVNGPTMMVNIGSAAGQQPVPYVAVYSGTKGYMLASI